MYRYRILQLRMDIGALRRATVAAAVTAVVIIVIITAIPVVVVRELLSMHVELPVTISPIFLFIPRSTVHGHGFPVIAAVVTLAAGVRQRIINVC